MEPATKATAAATARGRRAKRAYLILFVVAAVVAGLWVVHRRLSAGKETTDDAQIEADVVPLSARVGGTVKVAKVKDNQAVKAGDVLFEIDPADLEVEVARTQAELEAARAQESAAAAQVAIVESMSKGGLSSAKAALSGASASVQSTADSIRAAEASVARARADVAKANSDFAREQSLFDQQAITQSDLEHATQIRDVAKAGLDVAQAQLDTSRAQRGMAQARVSEAAGRVVQSGPVDQQVAAAQAANALATARVKAAQAAVDRAKLNRTYATVYAPADGTVSKLGVHPGQQVMMGQMLLMLVPTETYVVANFKETQIKSMKPGDKVEIELDALAGTFEGTVDTVAPATGARFSLLPPDNATGNFVKVVQRVPVKIVFTGKPPGRMVPGLSAEVTVHVSE